MHICDCHPKTGWLVDFYFILYSILFRICNYIPILYTHIFSANFTCHIPYYFPLYIYVCIEYPHYIIKPVYLLIKSHIICFNWVPSLSILSHPLYGDLYYISVLWWSIIFIYIPHYAIFCLIIAHYELYKFIPISIPLFLDLDHGTILQEKLYIYIWR